MRKLTGRKHEAMILNNALSKNIPGLIAIYGRRRVGKTFLVRQVYKNKICFEFSGINKVSLQQQLINFHLSLSKISSITKRPKNWLEAFNQLSIFLDKHITRKKKVVFIDEFPWLDTHKSNFLPAFDNFWNSYASKQENLVVVICGSAASYMINNILNNKGGLHNRLTERIQLQAFNLYETEQILKYNGIKLSRYDITKIYMSMGGIPNYLERVNPGESVSQAIDRLYFKKDGFLRTEFNNVFASLFNHSHNHEQVVRILAKTRKGLTRNELATKTKIKSGGTLSKTLIELENSGFIEIYLPFNAKKKDSLYRLSDEYSMFYLKYVENTKPATKGIWDKLQGKASYKIWSGFSFETICMKHIDQIRDVLKISGTNSTYESWIDKTTVNGAQIDLLINRDDNVINLCEIKFHNTEFQISKKYANELLNKMNTFIATTNTKKSIFITFITTYGLTENNYSKQIVQNQIILDSLFNKI